MCGILPHHQAAPIHSPVLLTPFTQERHSAALLAVQGNLQSPRKLAQLREIDICRNVLCVHVVEMVISYNEKEYVCTRDYNFGEQKFTQLVGR